MFYSHEILTSHQHGVATVWVLATLGQNCGGRRISRKAIQEVDVPKACMTIDNPPGAPIALRLQASLLYGVSRAYSQQYDYLLGDAEKARLGISILFRNMALSDTLDPNAGKAKRKQLILADDPNFHIGNFDLPRFELDEMGDAALPNGTQHTANLYSQLSPYGRSRSGSSGGRNSMRLDLDHDSFLGGYDLDSPFAGGSSAQKPRVDLDPFAEEEPIHFDDDLFTIDADGNIVDLRPPKPAEVDVPEVPQPDLGGPSAQQQDATAPVVPEDEQPLILEDQPLPDAEALPARQDRQDQDEQDIEQQQEIIAAAAPARRRGRKRRVIAPDRDTKISRNEYRMWYTDYMKRMEEEQVQINGRREPVTKEQARKEAYHRLFGRGIGGFGWDFGLPNFVHPLTDMFSGEGLQRTLFGQVLGQPSEPEPRGGRCRSASQAFGADAEEEEGRRVRQRSDEDQLVQPRDGLGPSQLEGGTQLLPEDAEPPSEVGREIGHALSDQPSMPWHRQSSVVPGSSLKGSSARRSVLPGGGPANVSESPLQHRGSMVQGIERFSDHVGSDGPSLGGGGESGFGSADKGWLPDHDEQDSGNLGSEGAASMEGRRFLDFLRGEANKTGSSRGDDEDQGLLWVDFDQVVQPLPGTQSVAAHAFYQVLCLTTGRVLKVDQDGRDTNEPFKPIRIGVPMASHGHEDQDGDE
ncbi:hypothetical protein RB597_009241 [Gaeumannomyces tritici]